MISFALTKRDNCISYELEIKGLVSACSKFKQMLGDSFDAIRFICHSQFIFRFFSNNLHIINYVITIRRI